MSRESKGFRNHSKATWPIGHYYKVHQEIIISSTYLRAGIDKLKGLLSFSIVIFSGPTFSICGLPDCTLV